MITWLRGCIVKKPKVVNIPEQTDGNMSLDKLAVNPFPEVNPENSKPGAVSVLHVENDDKEELGQTGLLHVTRRLSETEMEKRASQASLHNSKMRSMLRLAAGDD